METVKQKILKIVGDSAFKQVSVAYLKKGIECRHDHISAQITELENAGLVVRYKHGRDVVVALK